jgi:opacity protein-like surface antigen
MKSVAVHSAAISLLMVGAASAADIRMPVKAPPRAPVAVFSWTGCYVGAGGGYGMFVQRTTGTNNGVANTTPYDNGGRGWFGTVQVGCDYQVSPSIVVGAFADYDFSDIEGVMRWTGGPDVGKEKLRSSWAAGGRIGWLPSQQLLVFVSGGYTEGHFGRINLVGANTGISNNNFILKNTYTGWFVGAGHEYSLGWLPGLFWKTEYRFADYGTDRLPIFVQGNPSTFGIEAHKYVHTVRSELVWRFNTSGGATAVADARMPVKAPRAAPVAYTWTGCYLGAGGGYGMFDQELRATNPAASQRSDSGGRGWFGTVQAGCDYQAMPNIVIGAMADYDFSGIKGDVGFRSLTGREKLTASWAAGGRAGWVFPSHQLLVFVSGGYTEARFSSVELFNTAGNPDNTHLPKHTYSGWFLGSGYEYGIGWLPGLFWKSEYRFADYGNEQVPQILNANGATFQQIETHKYTHTVRSELVWRFNFGGGAVVARN